MSQKQRIQTFLLEPWPDHSRARELEVISNILENHPGRADAAWQDLTAGKRNDTAAEGMKAASDVGATVLQRLDGHPYESMAFTWLTPHPTAAS